MSFASLFGFLFPYFVYLYSLLEHVMKKISNYGKIALGRWNFSSTHALVLIKHFFPIKYIVMSSWQDLGLCWSVHNQNASSGAIMVHFLNKNSGFLLPIL